MASRCTATCARSSSRSTATSASLLTPDAIDYLRRYGPVGCRDWTTVYLLLSCDVPAFFSGCVTTTIDTRLPGPARAPPADAPVAYVDMPAGTVPPGAVTFAHSDTRSGGARSSRTPAARSSCSTPIAAATARSSRHGCTATCRSGRSACAREFRPKNRSDIRFDGLIDIDDQAFDAIRVGLLEQLEQVHTAILTGQPEAEVHALWRELTAADVAAAEERRMRPLALPPVAPEIGQKLRRAVARTVTHGGAADAAVHCAVVLPQGGGRALRALVDRMREHSSHPLHLWILARPGAGRWSGGWPRASRGCVSRVPIRGLGRRRPGWCWPTCSRTSAASSCCRRAAVAAEDVARAGRDRSRRRTRSRHPCDGRRQRLRRDPPRRGAARRPRRRAARAAPHGARAPPLRLRRVHRRRAGARPRAHAPRGLQQRGAAARAGVRPARLRGPALSGRARSRDGPGALRRRLQLLRRTPELAAREPHDVGLPGRVAPGQSQPQAGVRGAGARRARAVRSAPRPA